VSDRKGWADEALAYNILVTSWPQIQIETAKLAVGPAQSELALQQETRMTTNYQRVTEGFQTLTEVLAPYVAGELRAKYGDEW
jgi:hypothetical protein